MNFEDKVTKIVNEMTKDFVREHIHCKQCGRTIDSPTIADYFYGTVKKEHELKICKNCIEKIGLEAIKKENQEKEKDWEQDELEKKSKIIGKDVKN